jgi:arabinofuranan 3-O-arabinosyltransferase
MEQLRVIGRRTAAGWRQGAVDANGRPPRPSPRRGRGLLANRRAIPAALALGSLAAAFAQRPGEIAFDGRVELSVDPGRFLADLTDVWSSTTDLGHIASGQFVGYLVPIAPWYAFWEWVGLPTWAAQRLWLGLLLAAAAWGVVRLMDSLYDQGRGWAHLVAGVLYVANPYVVLNLSRSTATLLAYAALPWFLLAVHRGVRAPSSWRWPLAVAALTALGGGGVNAATLVWVPAAGTALALYELLLRLVSLRAVARFAWRAAVCSVVASAWWAIPAVLQSRYGADFLSYTEQPSAIWGTPSMSESLRLLGFWLMYIGVGGEPVMSVAPTYLFDMAVIVAGFLVPLIAFGGLRWTRRWAYGPFFGLLACAGLVIMALGFPDGAPMRDAMERLYADFEPVRFLRTTYKAAPLVALAFACLGGAGFAALIRLFAAVRRHPRGLRLPRWAPVVALAIPVCFALPLFQGRAIDPGQAYQEVPGYWTEAVADAERTTPADRRLMILPGSLFAWYRFGETVTSVAPALTERPVLVREVSRYADPRAAELQAYVDELVQQGRLVPGQLDPLLRLMGVGQLLIQADQRVPQSGSLEPARVEQALVGQHDLGRTLESYGARRRHSPFPGWGGRTVTLPDIRRVEGPGASGPGIVRVHSQERPVILDGDAEGVTELAAVGRLDPDRALFYAGDLDRSQLAGLLRSGAELVITDSNRRRPVDPNRTRENRGWTVGADDPIPADWPPTGLFAERGAEARTIAIYAGLEWLRSPLDRRFAIFPQYRPYAALDRDYETAWLPGVGTEAHDRRFELKFERPGPIRALRVLPHLDAIGRTEVVEISVNGGTARRFPVESGWNTLELSEPSVSTLGVGVTGSLGDFFEGGGGVTELEIPRLRLRESLRTPLLAVRQAARLDLSGNVLRVILQRTTADFAYRAGRIAGAPQAADPLDMVDAEPGIERTVELPVARRFRLSGWASASPAGDTAIDRMLGLSRGWRFDSSSRFEGVPGRRASSAFDGDPDTAWVGDWPGRRPSWIGWRSPHAVRIGHLRLLPGPGVHATAAEVEVIAGDRRFGPLPVRRGGHVRLPRRVRTGEVRLSVVSVQPPRVPARALRSVAIREVRAPGLRPPSVRRAGRFASECGELTVTAGRRRATARVAGAVSALDAGQPLRLQSCGDRGALSLSRGRNEVSAPPGSVFRPDHLDLSSPPPLPVSRETGSEPRVLDPGKAAAGRREGVLLDLAGPSWLVLGESYSSGWRAWCRDGAGSERALGEPLPVDGFGNGWRVDRSCREARFEWGPQRFATAGYVVSAAGAVIAGLLAVVVALVRRRRPSAVRMRREGAPGDGWPPFFGEDDPVTRVGWRRSLAIASAVGLVTGPLFALRAGAGLAATCFVVLMIGVSVHRLIAVGALALLAIPAWYWIDDGPGFGTVTFLYVTDQLTAHWLGVLAVSCFAAASWISAIRLRRRGAG